jgi:hypothetical protein
MKHNKNIVFSFKFSGNLNILQTLEFVQALFSSFNKTKMELDYVIQDERGKTVKFKSRGGEINTKVLNNFKSNLLLTNNDGISIGGFSIFANLPNWSFKAIDFDFYFNYDSSIYNDFCSFDIVLFSDWYDILDIKSFINTICVYLISNKCELLYGFMFVMESRKNPLAIINGHLTQFLTKYEDKKVQIWSENKDNCDTQIWDIFWGNIISKKHLAKISVEEIEKIVGSENVCELSPEVLWFNLPDNLLDFDFSDYSKTRKELYNYFDSKKLIMTEEK